MSKNTLLISIIQFIYIYIYLWKLLLSECNGQRCWNVKLSKHFQSQALLLDTGRANYSSEISQILVPNYSMCRSIQHASFQQNCFGSGWLQIVFDGDKLKHLSWGTFLTVNVVRSHWFLCWLIKFCKFVLGFYSINYWMDLHYFCFVLWIAYLGIFEK